MNCNAVIINETCHINLSMKFFVPFGIVQFEAIGFHLSHRLIIFVFDFQYIVLLQIMVLFQRLNKNNCLSKA